MASALLLGLLLMFHATCSSLARKTSSVQRSAAAVFDENYAVSWGADHVFRLDHGREIQLSMDRSSGSGFGSKSNYSSGFFHMKIKVPGNDSAGVVTAFYLSSSTSRHDELDFEFLGNRAGKPITLQTNIFTNGHGNREQRFHLWFDPTRDFHDYMILWNPYHIVFFVDNIPIRIYGNKSNAGVEYPSQPMHILASIWDGEDWATDGGRAKINWSLAPFMAHFQGFNVDGCTLGASGVDSCSSPGLWWNAGRYIELNPNQKVIYRYIRKTYMNYDYCSDTKKFPTPPPECLQ